MCSDSLWVELVFCLLCLNNEDLMFENWIGMLNPKIINYNNFCDSDFFSNKTKKECVQKLKQTKKKNIF